MYFDRDIQSLESAAEDEGLKTMRMVLKNLIKNFRTLEQPYLKEEFRHQDAAHWSATPTYLPSSTDEKSPRSRRNSHNSNRNHLPQYNNTHHQHYNNHSDNDDDTPTAQYMHSTDQMGQEYKSCGFKERWLWVRQKSAFINLNEVLSRIEVRRTAHEVGEVLSMVCNIGRDMQELRGALDGVEGRLNRVVGVRRVD